jgi:hypothetical protein
LGEPFENFVVSSLIIFIQNLQNDLIFIFSLFDSFQAYNPKMMKTVMSILAFLPVARAFKVNVCFTVANKGVQGAKVQCYDSDWGTDDKVGPNPAYTDSDGCVSINDDQSWWERPDIYCKVYANGDCFGDATTNTKNDHRTNRDANFGTIALTSDPDYCGNFGADSNGCGPGSFPSWLSDGATEVSGFANQCGAHDNCYGDCTKKRSKCDADFLDDMNAVCAGSSSCSVLAKIYYEAVDSPFGEDACQASRDGGVCNTAEYNLCSQ